LLGVEDHRPDRATRDVGGDLSDLRESRRRRSCQGDWAVVGPAGSEDHRGGLGGILARRPGHRPIGGNLNEAGLPPRTEQPAQAVGVEAVAQRSPGQAGLGKQLFGGGMIASRAERRVRMRALVAGVENAADARAHSCGDGAAVQRYRVGVWVARRDQQELIRVGGRGWQCLGLGIVGAAYLDAACCEPLRPRGIANRDSERLGGQALQQMVDRGAVECAGSASNNDHLTSFDYRWKQLHNINGSMLLAIERYRWNHGGGERDGADEREWEK